LYSRAVSNCTKAHASAYGFFTFSIAGHSLKIIEVDGVNVEPLLVDSIQIFAGQRYSFILTADQPFSNYWIRAVSSNGHPGFDGGINSAILKYITAPIIDPITPDPPTTPEVASTNPMLETNLHPLSNPFRVIETIDPDYQFARAKAGDRLTDSSAKPLGLWSFLCQASRERAYQVAIGIEPQHLKAGQATLA